MSFQKLSPDTLRTIRPLLEKMFPTSAMMLNLVNIELSGSCRDDDVDIYGFIEGSESEINEENLFINVFIRKPESERQEYSILYAPKVVTNVMLEAFALLYDWSEPRDFGAVPEHFSLHLKKVFDEKGGTGAFYPCTDLYLPVEDAMKLDLKRQDLEAEFAMDKLVYENGAKVNSHWKYGGDKGEVSIGYAINALGGAGVFKKPLDGDSNLDKRNDNLISWVAFLRLGTLNALHTLDEYRGRGLGRWTMEAASKSIAQQGYIPLCEVEPYNQQSRRLVEKIGYQIVQEVNWVDYKPKVQS